MSECKTTYTKPYDRINDAYIAGLFDAEGNIYIGWAKKLKCYVKITQKGCPDILKKIQSYLGFGHIQPSEEYRIRFYSKADVTEFYKRVKPFSKIKLKKLEELLYLMDNPNKTQEYLENNPNQVQKKPVK